MTKRKEKEASFESNLSRIAILAMLVTSSLLMEFLQSSKEIQDIVASVAGSQVETVLQWHGSDLFMTLTAFGIAGGIKETFPNFLSALVPLQIKIERSGSIYSIHEKIVTTFAIALSLVANAFGFWAEVQDFSRTSIPEPYKNLDVSRGDAGDLFVFSIMFAATFLVAIHFSYKLLSAPSHRE